MLTEEGKYRLSETFDRISQMPGPNILDTTKDGQDLEIWYQGHWVQEHSCGTSACFAGWYCIFWLNIHENSSYAMDLMGADVFGTSVDNLTLEEYEILEKLVHSRNSLSDIRTILNELGVH